MSIQQSTGSSSALNWVLYDFWQDNGQPFSSHLPLVKSPPWTIVSIIGVYLLFVYKIGPGWMRNRQPYEMKSVITAYNIFHIACNGVLGTIALILTHGTYDCWTCKTTGDPNSTGDNLLLNLTYFYFLAKFLDLLDTVFFILRKKYSQVTPLHVIHHSIMPICTYLSLKFTPIGRTSIIGTLNSLVHCVMYTYYLLSSMPEFSKNLWWKKYLTILQIFQFVIFFVHAIQGLFMINCPNFPVTISIMELLNSLFFMKTFTDFFIRTYKLQKSKQL